MAQPIRCHLCGSVGGHTRQCSLNIKINTDEAKEREERKKRLDDAKVKMPKPKLDK